MNQITITGNEVFPDGQIRDQMNLHTAKPLLLRRASEFNKRVLRLDVISIQNYYKQHGYLNCTVQDSFSVGENRRVDVFLTIQEGDRYYLERLEITGNILLSEEEILRHFSAVESGEPFNIYTLQENIQELENLYKNQGKPFVNINSRLSFKGSQVTVTVDVEENQTVYIQKIRIAETPNVEPDVIRREITLDPGDRYDHEMIRESQRRIFETGLFADVNIVPVPASTDSQNVILQVNAREMEFRTISFSMGAGQSRSDESGEPFTTLEMTAEWIHRNLLATGRRLDLEAGMELNINALSLRPEASISYTEPWIWKYRVPMTWRLFYDHERYPNVDRPIYKWGSDLSFLHTRRRELILRSTLAWQQVLLPEGTPTNEDIQRDRVRDIELLFRRDTRQNYLYPSQGMVLEVLPKIYGGWLGGTAHFYQIEASVSKYWSLGANTTLAGRIKVGSQHLYNGMYGNIPEWLLFKLGGATSVRGFQTNRLKTRPVREDGQVTREAVGDQVKVIANLELRFPIYWQFGGEIFLDAGELQSDYSRIDILTLRHTAGFGITFATPLGPVRLDFGRKLGKIEPYENRWVTSLALQYAF